MNISFNEPNAEILSINVQSVGRFRWLELSLLAAAVCVEYVATHVPGQYVANIRELHEYDKLLHGSAFFTLSVLAGLRLAMHHRLSAGTWLGWGAGLGAFAALDELSQIPFGRDCAFADWCADLVGITTGLMGILGLCHVYKRRASSDVSSWRIRHSRGDAHRDGAVTLATISPVPNSEGEIAEAA